MRIRSALPLRHCASTSIGPPALAVQSREFRDRMMMIKYTQAMSNGYCFADPDDIAAVDFVPDEAFVQTPGPGAGSALKA